MSNAVGDLASLLRDADIRVSFDGERDATKPCVICGGYADEREWNELVVVGCYVVATAGGIRPGDAVERPVCVPCREQLPIIYGRAGRAQKAKRT